MTTRIRWEVAHDGEATGRVGSLDWPVFRIWPPDEKGDCMLFVYLAGHQGDLYHGDTADGQKAKAERLLSEFVSSLGAGFPPDPECSECGFRQPTHNHDKGCSHYREAAAMAAREDDQ